MAHHQTRRGPKQSGRRAGLGGRESQPVHAGVEMQRGGACPRPFGDLRQGVQHGPQPGRLEPWRGPRRDPVEHIDDRLARHGAGPLALARAGDEEGLAAGRQQRAHDRLQPKPVGVGLDDGGALGRRAAFGEPPPIMRQRGKVDGERRGFARAKLRVRGRRGRVHRDGAAHMIRQDGSILEQPRGGAQFRARRKGSAKRVFLLPKAGAIVADGEDS